MRRQDRLFDPTPGARKDSASHLVVTVMTFLVLQAIINLSRLPATLIVESIGKFVGVILVEFDTTVIGFN